MFVDAQNQFAPPNTWSPTAVGNNISPNVVDTGPFGGQPNANTGTDFGESSGLWVLITVNTAAVGAGATVDFRVRTDSNPNMTTTPADVVATGAQPVASLTGGQQYRLKLPSTTYQRYLAINAVIAGAVLTAGTFEAELVQGDQVNTKYAGAFGVS